MLFLLPHEVDGGISCKVFDGFSVSLPFLSPLSEVVVVLIDALV